MALEALYYLSPEGEFVPVSPDSPLPITIPELEGGQEGQVLTRTGEGMEWGTPEVGTGVPETGSAFMHLMKTAEDGPVWVDSSPVYIWDDDTEHYQLANSRTFVGATDPATDGYTLADGDQWVNPDA